MDDKCRPQRLIYSWQLLIILILTCCVILRPHSTSCPSLLTWSHTDTGRGIRYLEDANCERHGVLHSAGRVHGCHSRTNKKGVLRQSTSGALNIPIRSSCQDLLIASLVPSCMVMHCNPRKPQVTSRCAKRCTRTRILAIQMPPRSFRSCRPLIKSSATLHNVKGRTLVHA